tara:strand:- start:273 stop:728 length:456 start_codon:yes stop_codon:yes gene_type:complete
MSIIISSAVENQSFATDEELSLEPTKVTFEKISRKVTFSGDYLVQVSGTEYHVVGADINPHETDFMVRFTGGRGTGVKSVSLVIGEEDASAADTEIVFEDLIVEPLYSVSGGYTSQCAKKEVEVVMTTLRESLRNYEDGSRSVVDTTRTPY